MGLMPPRGPLVHLMPSHEHAFAGGRCPSVGKVINPAHIKKNNRGLGPKVICRECDALIFLPKNRTRLKPNDE